jgi:CheY-like chemotaxis protein
MEREMRPDPRAAAVPPPRPANLSGVLLVEDEAALSQILRRNLEARRYRVRTAATAQEAIAAVQAEPPAVMLLDINLPDGSGWDVLRALRAGGQRVPTIVLSAVRCSPARLDEFAPDAYLPKPFPLAALMAAVERLSSTPPERPPRIDKAPHRESAGSGRKGETPMAIDRVPTNATSAEASGSVAQPEPGAAGREGETAPRRCLPAQPDAQPNYATEALLDVVADPRSGIIRTHLAGASPATIEWLEMEAAHRGLHTRSACSPSLQRGWMVVDRGRPGELGEGGEPGERGERGNGRPDFRRIDGGVFRADARLRRGLREALAWVRTWGSRVPQRESV